MQAPATISFQIGIDKFIKKMINLSYCSVDKRKITLSIRLIYFAEHSYFTLGCWQRDCHKRLGSLLFALPCDPKACNKHFVTKKCDMKNMGLCLYIIPMTTLLGTFVSKLQYNHHLSSSKF